MVTVFSTCKLDIGSLAGLPIAADIRFAWVLLPKESASSRDSAKVSGGCRF